MEEIKINIKKIKEKVNDLCQQINNIIDYINDLEDKIEIEEIEMLEKEIMKNKSEDTANDGWKPEYGQTYWFVDLDTMDINKSRWFNGGSDKARLRHKVIFKTEAKAVEYSEYLEEKEKHINTFTEKEWENIDVEKWYYYYDCKAKTIISCAFKRYAKENMPYFKTEEEVKDFIKKYEWQIKHELGVK